MSGPLALRLPPLPTIRDLLKIYKLQALKQLSQNFLLDSKLTNKIVCAGRPKWQRDYSNFVIVEVGPGPGGLTRSILNLNPRKVILIEKDRRFSGVLNLLKECAGAGKVETHWGDVLSFNMSKILEPAGDEKVPTLRKNWQDQTPNIRIIGNLPFNISTPLIVRWLRDISLQQNAWSWGRVPMVLTFQQEVAERLAAGPSEDQRCRLSIMAQYLTDVKHCFDIPGSAFVPKPDVNVGIVKFIPKKEPLYPQHFDLVEKVVRHIFSMRRKILKHPVGTLFPESIRDELTPRILDMTGVDPQKRPFQLTNEEFGDFIRAYAQLCERYPIITDYNYRGYKPNEIWDELYDGTTELEEIRSESTDYDSMSPFSQKLRNENETEPDGIDSREEQEIFKVLVEEDPSIGLPTTSKSRHHA